MNMQGRHMLNMLKPQLPQLVECSSRQSARSIRSVHTSARQRKVKDATALRAVSQSRPIYLCDHGVDADGRQAMAAIGLIHLASSESHRVKLFQTAGGAAASSSREGLHKHNQWLIPKRLSRGQGIPLPVHFPRALRRTKSNSRPGPGSSKAERQRKRHLENLEPRDRKTPSKVRPTRQYSKAEHRIIFFKLLSAKSHVLDESIIDDQGKARQNILCSSIATGCHITDPFFIPVPVRTA